MKRIGLLGMFAILFGLVGISTSHATYRRGHAFAPVAYAQPLGFAQISYPGYSRHFVQRFQQPAPVGFYPVNYPQGCNNRNYGGCNSGCGNYGPQVYYDNSYYQPAGYSVYVGY